MNRDVTIDSRWAEDWAGARRILCVRLDTLGDVLMTTPAIRAIKETGARRQITLLTSPAGAAAGPMIAEIDDVMVYQPPWMKASAAHPNSLEDQSMINTLRARGFDAAVIFTVFSQNPLPAALFCYLADIPLRLAHCRENPYQLLSHWIKESEPEQGIRHEVQRQLDLAASIGCITRDPRLSFRVPGEARACMTRRLEHAGVNLNQPWLVLHPGVTAPSRQYNPGSFASAARQLVLEDGIQIVFSGNEAEIALVEHIRAAMGVPSVSFAGKQTLGELGALIELSPLLLANNTGPVHIAAALGTPVVDLYALTNPQHTPWQVPQRVLNQDVPCKYCYRSICPEGHHHCLELVRPQVVVEAVRSLLAQAAGIIC
jgi:lipopolysaccharide heptosyltransferase II